MINIINIISKFLRFQVEVDQATFEIPQYYRSLNSSDYSLCISGNIATREMSSNGNLPARC